MDKKLQQLIFFVFWSYLFLLPLLFLPYNSELFEFNKTLLTYLAATIILALWLLRSLCRGRFFWRPTPFAPWLLLFLLSQTISTIFSIHPYTSFWGYYSRFHQGLLSTISYLVLYWGLTSNLDQKASRSLLKAIIAGATVSALWGFAEHFGIDKNYWLQDVQNRVFSTFGQPNWLAAYLAAVFFLLLALPQTRRWRRWSLYLLFFSVIYFTKSRSGILGLSGGLFLLLLYQLKLWRQQSLKERGQHLLKNQAFLFLLLSLGLILFNRHLFAFLPLGKNSAPPKPPPHYLITPSSKIREIVWQGAIKLWRRYPLFGSGNETFAYSYYWVRPVAHNLTSEWDFLYNKAHNEYLNWAANNGTVGLVSYLLFPLAFLFWAAKVTSPPQTEIIYLAAALGSILISNFFGFSVTAVAVLFYLFPALAFLLSQPATLPASFPDKCKLGFTRKIGAFFVIIAAFWLGSQIANYWRADYFYARSGKDSQQQNYLRALKDAQKAVALRPHQAIYWGQLGNSLASLAFLSHQASPSNRRQWQLLSQNAVAANRQALRLNPFHLNLYKEVARNYYLLALVNPSYFRQVIAVLKQASQLAPTDAKIYYNLGQIYHQQKKEKEALRYLKKAVQLKTNYEAARWQLAQIYHQQKKDRLARQELEFILKYLDPESSAASQLLKKLKL